MGLCYNLVLNTFFTIQKAILYINFNFIVHVSIMITWWKFNDHWQCFKITTGTLVEMINWHASYFSTTWYLASCIVDRKEGSLSPNLVKRNIADQVCHNQQKQKVRHDQGNVQSFEIDSYPCICTEFLLPRTQVPHGWQEMWLTPRDNVTNTKRQCSYEVSLPVGHIVYRHSDYIQARTVTVDQSASMTDAMTH